MEPKSEAQAFHDAILAGDPLIGIHMKVDEMIQKMERPTGWRFLVIVQGEHEGRAWQVVSPAGETTTIETQIAMCKTALALFEDMLPEVKP